MCLSSELSVLMKLMFVQSCLKLYFAESEDLFPQAAKVVTDKSKACSKKFFDYLPLNSFMIPIF